MNIYNGTAMFGGENASVLCKLCLNVANLKPDILCKKCNSSSWCALQILIEFLQIIKYIFIIGQLTQYCHKSYNSKHIATQMHSLKKNQNTL